MGAMATPTPISDGLVVDMFSNVTTLYIISISDMNDMEIRTASNVFFIKHNDKLSVS